MEKKSHLKDLPDLKHTPKTPSNVTLVTGFSGSGKSTISTALEKKSPKNILVELDGFEHDFDTTEKLKLVKKFVKKNGLYNKDNKNVDNKMIMEYLFDEAKKRPENNFIIEGVQVLGVPPKVALEHNVIVKGTGLITSSKRRSKRDKEMGENMMTGLKYNKKINDDLDRLRAAIDIADNKKGKRYKQVRDGKLHQDNSKKASSLLDEMYIEKTAGPVKEVGKMFSPKQMKIDKDVLSEFKKVAPTDRNMLSHGLHKDKNAAIARKAGRTALGAAGTLGAADFAVKRNQAMKDIEANPGSENVDTYKLASALLDEMYMEKVAISPVKKVLGLTAATTAAGTLYGAAKSKKDYNKHREEWIKNRPGTPKRDARIEDIRNVMADEALSDFASENPQAYKSMNSNDIKNLRQSYKENPRGNEYDYFTDSDWDTYMEEEVELMRGAPSPKKYRANSLKGSAAGFGLGALGGTALVNKDKILSTLRKTASWKSSVDPLTPEEAEKVKAEAALTPYDDHADDIVKMIREEARIEEVGTEKSAHSLLDELYLEKQATYTPKERYLTDDEIIKLAEQKVVAVSLSSPTATEILPSETEVGETPVGETPTSPEDVQDGGMVNPEQPVQDYEPPVSEVGTDEDAYNASELFTSVYMDTTPRIGSDESIEPKVVTNEFGTEYGADPDDYESITVEV